MTFHFATPWVLALLVVVPLIAALPWLSRRWARPAGMRYADTSMAVSAGRSWRLTLRPVLIAVRLLAIALAIVALARPQATEAREVVQGEGVDIALALDISGSMSSLDFEPRNRLEAAKTVISDFVEERPYDRLGLVVFASESFIQSPPTIDHAFFKTLLDEVKLATDLRIDDGTAIGHGLASAANMLKDSEAESKVIILLTDGANNTGHIDPGTAALAVKALDIKVYTIGAGRPGLVSVPQRTRFGTRIVRQQSDLDEETLKEIARTTNGRYFRAEDSEGLRQTYEEINQLEKSQIEVRQYTKYRELAGWLLGPAIALMLLELLARNTIFRRIP